MRRSKRKARGAWALVAAAGLCAGSPAGGQSLFRKPVEPPAPEATALGVGAASPDARGNPVAELEGVSLYAIQPPEPRQIRVHDLVTIIVNQSSRMEHDQSLDTKKELDVGVEIDSTTNLLRFLELYLEAGNQSGLPEIGISTDNEFKGEGAFEREDRVTARITAEVIDVKPNGLLVLEAKATITTDRETQVMVLSGLCRQEDVTAQNTVQSTQLADLVLTTRNTGDVKNGSDKGVITRILDALLAF